MGEKFSESVKISRIVLGKLSVHRKDKEFWISHSKVVLFRNRIKIYCLDYIVLSNFGILELQLAISKKLLMKMKSSPNHFCNRSNALYYSYLTIILKIFSRIMNCQKHF